MSEPEPHGAAFFTLAPELESAPGPWPPGAGDGAAQKSGGSDATLGKTLRSVILCGVGLLAV